MHTPTGPPNLQHMQRFPSMTSMQSTYSLTGPGHSYVPRKQKPEKPYGLSFVTRMNRTHRGPGKRYLKMALACFIIALFFFMGTALYFGHRNVSRMIVARTEVLGAAMLIAGICFIALMGHYIFKARVMSNRWRANIRFRPEGLNTAAAVNEAYVPEDEKELKTGTYGPRALKAVPKRGKKKKGKSKDNLARRRPEPVPEEGPLAVSTLTKEAGGAYGQSYNIGFESVQQGYGIPPQPRYEAPQGYGRPGYPPPQAFPQGYPIGPGGVQPPYEDGPPPFQTLPPSQFRPMETSRMYEPRAPRGQTQGQGHMRLGGAAVAESEL